MKKVKTAAALAEEELNEFLGEENILHKEYHLQYRRIDAMQIEGTVDDILLLLFEPNYLRPGFKVEDNTAELPCIFCKFTGDTATILDDFRLWKKRAHFEVSINNGYKGIAKSPRKHAFSLRPKWFNKETGINIALALKDDLGPLNFLTPAYRKNYLEAINDVLAYFKSHHFNLEPPTQREILETLIYNSNKIIKMFHHYDYQKHAPKFVIDERGKKLISQFAVVRLLMMHNLGFDVIMVSDSGFSSIENYLPDEDCPIYRLTTKEKVYSISYQQKKSRVKWLKIAAVLIIVVLALFFGLRIL